MTQLDITDGTGSEAIADAQTNFTELYTEIIAARKGEADLLTEINLIWSSIDAMTVGSGTTISTDDTTPGHLSDKLVGGKGVIALTILNPAANEDLEINVGSEVSSGDTTPGYLDDKLIGSDNITLTKGNAGADETLAVSFNGTTTAKTGDHTLTAAEMNGANLFTNTGASGEVNFSLPAIASGLACEFYVTASQYLKVTADTGENFRIGTILGDNSGYIRSNILGTHFRIRANGVDWAVDLIQGTLNYDE